MSTIRKPVQRLASIKNPPPVRRAQPQSAVRTCPNPSCPDPQIDDVEGNRVCTTCGTLVSDSNIVSEVQFGETSSGAAVVQGSYVGADQSHARSMGTAFKRAGGLESREAQEASGKRYTSQIAAALGLPQSLSDQAFQNYKLAIGNNFIQGRTIRNVAGICMYVACRKQEKNSTMLIDIAQVLNINVFKLGRIYKDMIRELHICLPKVVPEHLIYKFATKLEFEEKTMKVAEDAVVIMQRMCRDWMTDGRRPAGLCGACLILAARMNNFRRSVREVVYVVKVTDVTINLRLGEFKVTDTSDLTVDEFRRYGLQVGSRREPPVYVQQRDGKKGKKRKRTRQLGDEEPEVISDSESQRATSAQPAGSRSSSTGPSNTQTGRRDSDGFAIPDVPIDPDLLAAGADALSQLATEGQPSSSEEQPPAKRPRGRPSKSDPRSRLPVITEYDLAVEYALENEMLALLNDPNTSVHAEAYAASLAKANALVAAQRAEKQQNGASTNPNIDDAEFDDDPEVANCLLSPEEVEVKERIWVHENRDWLRAKQAKILKEQAEGPKKPVRKRKRKARMGDMSGREGEVSGASSPAEAVNMMLERRGLSKKINYKVMEGLFDKSDSGSASSGQVSGAGSGNATPVANTPAPIEVVDEGADEEEDEEEVEEGGEENVEGAVNDEVEDALGGLADEELDVELYDEEVDVGFDEDD
ncbi:MAG: transcription factor TFIIIB subunit brf1 [Candelina mexicana]|nr:MAG: transcription factor TFIIIB subunit brf1 [Candelina mexicana]